MLKLDEADIKIKIFNPCINLWIAVLVRAIKDLHSKDRIVRQDAKEWIDSNNTSFCSFISVCKILDLDPEKVRDKNITNCCPLEACGTNIYWYN